MRKLTICLLAVAACGSKKKQGSDETKSAAPAAAVETAATAKSKAPLDRARLQALLDAWLAAQNNGDFAAYSRLYAGKFYGVKRVGARTFRYNREGWLADRERMFKKKMTVEAREQKPFDASTRSATIEFVQRWASGRFEDLGPKRLLVVLEGDQLKIAQEEMLRSEVTSNHKAAGEGFYFLYQGDLVLHDAAAPEKHGKPAEVDDASEAITTAAAVAEADLDAATRAWKGKKVRVGECEATVSGFRLVSRVVPHFGTSQEWRCDEHVSSDDCVPATDEQRHQQAFDIGTARVVATLDGCDDARFATALDRPAPIDGETVDDPALASRATAAFARLDEVRDQADPEHPSWWTGATVAIFKHPNSGQTLVSVYAADGEGCGGFEASYWQLWELEGGKLVELSSGTAPSEIYQAIDVDADGTLELIVKGDEYGSELVLVDPQTMARPVEFGYDYHDCPC